MLQSRGLDNFSPYEYTVVQAELVENFPFQMEYLRAFDKNQSSI